MNLGFLDFTTLACRRHFRGEEWRPHHPAPATLVPGLKCEIGWLERVHAGPGDDVLVCDISMARNRPALLRLLAQGARVRYFDHHTGDEVPIHPNLESNSARASAPTCSWTATSAARIAAGGPNELCSRFGGAGRAAAAGIDRLATQELDHFIRHFAVAR